MQVLINTTTQSYEKRIHDMPPEVGLMHILAKPILGGESPTC